MCNSFKTCVNILLEQVVSSPELNYIEPPLHYSSAILPIRIIHSQLSKSYSIVTKKTFYANATQREPCRMSEQTKMAEMNSLKVKASSEVEIDRRRYINLALLAFPKVRRWSCRDSNPS